MTSRVSPSRGGDVLDEGSEACGAGGQISPVTACGVVDGGLDLRSGQSRDDDPPSTRLLKPFAPDTRMTRILTDAVAIGNATARALALRPREQSHYFYPDSQWWAPIPSGSYEWLKDGGDGARNLDARTLFFYQATLNTPAMMYKMVGAGSQYAGVSTDSDGNVFDGGKTYRLTIPADVPAKNFWSVVVYDTQTRSELQTGQPLPSKNNQRGDVAVNPDGSVDLYFGPAAPEGHETNWIETVPGKSGFTYLRLYGPLDPWFDKTWRPGEVEVLS